MFTNISLIESEGGLSPSHPSLRLWVYNIRTSFKTCILTIRNRTLFLLFSSLVGILKKSAFKNHTLSSESLELN